MTMSIVYAALDACMGLGAFCTESLGMEAWKAIKGVTDSFGGPAGLHPGGAWKLCMAIVAS